MCATLLFSNLFRLTLYSCSNNPLYLLNIRWKIVPYLSSEKIGGGWFELNMFSVCIHIFLNNEDCKTLAPYVQDCLILGSTLYSHVDKAL
jgi:hypothetical protein